MSTWAKIITLVLVTIFFVTALHSSITNAQTTQFYGRGYYGPTSYLNYCSFYITIYSPNDQTTYVNTIPIKFNITWTEYPNFPIPALYGYYAYSIDDGPFVEIMSNQSDSDVFYQTSKNNFTLNPSFSYLVDISHLEKGHHNIVINASLYNQNRSPPPIFPPDHLYFSMTTSPYIFAIGETTATSTPLATPQPTLIVSLSESASALNYGDKINFTATADGGVAPYTFKWYVDNQNSGSGSSPYFSIDSMPVGSHHVYVKVNDANKNSATTNTVEFNVLPTSNPSPSPSIPEFPTWIILPLAMISVILAVLGRKKQENYKKLLAFC